jgi:putative redox protein|tara:strand:+ start:171 stop:584 length:414 start_codon:yes stop_codon:yes gene_type:complete
MTTNTVITNWKNGTTEFECISPNGVKTVLGTSTENNKIASPKAMMLSSLAVCSGLDIVAILGKMRVELDNFKINTVASLTEEHPKYYDEVKVQYQFFGKDLDKEKIEKAVNLSVTRYCGVMEMFRGFSKLKTEIKYN